MARPGGRGFALLAGILSLDAAASNEQFWRVGTAITIAWTLATLLLFLVPTLERALARSDLWLAPAALLVGAAAVGTVALLRGPFSPQGYSIFFTLVAAVGAIGVLFAGVVCIERGARVGWAAVVLAPIALAMIADGIWEDTDDRFRYISTGIVLLLSVLTGLSAFLYARTRLLLPLAIGSAAAAAMAAAISLDGIWGDDQLLVTGKLTNALWIVATALCLLMPLLERSIASPAGAEVDA